MARKKVPSKNALPTTLFKLPKLPKINLQKITSYRPSKKGWIIILIIGLILLAYFKKNWFIAATVNGQPISNFEVLSSMNDQYRQQTLNQLINEQIVKQEASKKGVAVTNSEIDARINELEQNVGGADVLDSLLTQQGQTRQTFRDQIKIQLMVEALYGNQATISATEVDQYIATNKDQLTATTSAAQKTEAENLLKQQKLSQIFNTQFQQLRSNADVVIY